MVQSIRPYVRSLRSIPRSLFRPGAALLRSIPACLQVRSPALGHGPGFVGARPGRPRTWMGPPTMVKATSTTMC